MIRIGVSGYAKSPRDQRRQSAKRASDDSRTAQATAGTVKRRIRVVGDSLPWDPALAASICDSLIFRMADAHQGEVGGW